MPHPNIYSQLCKENPTNPDDHHNRHDQVRPVSLCLRRGDVSPRHHINAGDIGLFTVRIHEISPGSTYIIDWEKYRKYQARERDEDNEECLEISKEEVGVEAAFLNDLPVSVCEDGLHPKEKLSWRRTCSFSFRNKIRLRNAKKH